MKLTPLPGLHKSDLVPWTKPRDPNLRHLETANKREDPDLVANLMAFHGWWGRTVENEIAHLIEWEEYQDEAAFCDWRERRRARLE